MKPSDHKPSSSEAKKRFRLRLTSILDLAAQKKRRLVMALGGVLGVVLVIAVLLHPNPKPVQHTAPVRAIRIEPNVGAYEAWQANQEVNIHQTAHQVQGLQSHVDQQQSQTQQLQQSVDQLQRSLSAMKSELLAVKTQNQSTQQALQQVRIAKEKVQRLVSKSTQSSRSPQPGNTSHSLLRVHRPRTLSISTPPTRLSNTDQKSLPLKPNPYVGTLPAGAFVKATLLTGLDAGTGQGAQANPYPVTLRVMSNAILPMMGDSPFKHYHLKGCFVLGSAYGSLSEERVFIRTSHLSCLDHSGNRLVSSHLKGYVVDSDGKAGLRGKLINRQGEKLGMAFLAGFSGGVGESAASTAGSSSTSALGSVTTYNATQGLSAGAFSGLGKAGSELSDFYIQMAKSIYPVIVINAGRNVTIDLEQDAPLKWVSENKPFVPDTKKLSSTQSIQVLKAHKKRIGGHA